jgi:hypothetical protein
MGTINAEVYGVIGNGFRRGDSKVEVSEGLLNMREVGDLPQAESRELAIFFRSPAITLGRGMN